MGFLDSLAVGLRGAGSVLNPEVQRQVSNEYLQRQNIDENRKNFVAQQVIKGIETGAIPEEQGRAVLERIGLNVPVGQSPEAKARTEAVERRKKIEEGVLSLPEERRRDPIALAEVFLKNGDYERGSQFMQHAEQRQDRIQARADQLAAKEAELTLRLQDRALDRASREQIARESNALRAQIAQITAEIARGNQELQRLRLESGDNKKRDQDDAKVDQKVTDLSKRLDKDNLTFTISTVDNVNKEFGKYITEGPDGKLKVSKDIPGLGYGTTLPGASFVLSDEGKRNRSMVQAVANDMLKLYSGGAVTLNENERRQVEMMASGNFKAQDFVNAWPMMVDRINAYSSNLKAGYAPEVVKRYQERGGVSLEQRTPFNKGKKTVPPPEGFKPD